MLFTGSTLAGTGGSAGGAVARLTGGRVRWTTARGAGLRTGRTCCATGSSGGSCGEGAEEMRWASPRDQPRSVCAPHFRLSVIEGPAHPAPRADTPAAPAGAGILEIGRKLIPLKRYPPWAASRESLSNRV